MFNEHRIWARLTRQVHAAGHCRRGVAAIEFGITMAAIVVIVLGTYDIGNYILQQMKLTDAARVGGLYAISYPADTAGITTAIDQALPSAWSDVTITAPSMTCTCAETGTGDAATCSATCASGFARFMVITVQRDYSPLLIGAQISMSGTYYARIQ